MAESESKRKRYLKRYRALEKRRKQWDQLWKRLRDYVNPERFRFTEDEVNEGDDIQRTLYNNAPQRASRVFSAGLMTGNSSPSRKWFLVTTDDPRAIEDDAEGRAWLQLVEDGLYQMFARSNTYSGLFDIYEDLATPGTGVSFVEEDREDVIRFYSVPCGSYLLASSCREAIDTLYRQVTMTVGQLVEQFGLEACSDKVREMYNRGQTEEERRVLHVVEPNTERDPRYIDNRNMPFRSVWMELQGSEHEGLLRESGYEEFPVLAPRWMVLPGDVYGRSAGMRALGDAEALQAMEVDKQKIIQQMAEPSLRAPASMNGARLTTVPGDVTFVPDNAQVNYEPVYVPTPAALAAVVTAIDKAEYRIDAAFDADLFRMFLNDNRSQVTAEEIRARRQEQMLQMGPALERLNDELYDRLIDRAFAIGLRLGFFPPPPKSLQGRRLKVEYVSVMAQAQKLVGTTAVERLVSFVLSLVQFEPTAVLSLDLDKVIAEYAKMWGVSPDLLRSAKEVAELRAKLEAQKAQMQQGQAMLAAAKGARDLAGAQISDDNALGRMLAATTPGPATIPGA